MQACYINTQIQGQCIYCYNVFLKLTFDFNNSYCLLEAIFFIIQTLTKHQTGLDI